MNFAEKIQAFLKRTMELIDEQPNPRCILDDEGPCPVGMGPAEAAAKELDLPAWVLTCDALKTCSHKFRWSPRTFFNAVHARCTGADRESMKHFLDEREAQFAASYAEAKRLFGGIGPN